MNFVIGTGTMKLKLDRKKTYAVALQGGGAKGGYEVGVWMALREAGIRFSAVSGTSVGALIGAMMVTDDFETARRVWEDMSMDKVLYVDPKYRESLRTMVSKRIGLLFCLLSEGFPFLHLHNIEFQFVQRHFHTPFSHNSADLVPPWLL